MTPLFKKIWFQTHWLLGITAGIVLAIVGVTGAMLSYEHELLRLINPGVMTVDTRAGGPLAPAALLERITASNPDRQIMSLTVYSAPSEAARVGFVPRPEPRAGLANPAAKKPAARQRADMVYVDPYSGELLGKPRGEGFFRLTTQIHRFLAADKTGKAVVGAATIGLLVLCLSGLYLRWPRRAADWRAWLTFDVKRTGRGFLWDMHSVIGTWVLIPYLVAGLTGLYWSYDWYRDGLFAMTGAPRPVQQAGPANETTRASKPSAVTGSRRPTGQSTQDAASPGRQSSVPGDFNTVWATFEREVPTFDTATVRFAQKPGQPAQVQYLTPDAAHKRASDRLTIDARTGAVTAHERYVDKPAGGKLMSSMFALHSGDFFGAVGVALMMIASLLMPLFAITGWMLYLQRRKIKKTANDARQATAQPLAAAAQARSESSQSIPELLIAFASQTGSAERLAWQTAGSLRQAGLPVTVEPLGRVTVDTLNRFRHALFVVSTFGDGEAPDQARPFARLMQQAPLLSNLRFGLLALGDRQYQTFCGFGKSLDNWLKQHGARPLFERIDVDRTDPSALDQWQRRLSGFAGVEQLAADLRTAPASDDWSPWRLCGRQLLNSGSVGNPTFHLELVPSDGNLPTWHAGDIAEIRPRNSADRVRSVLSRLGIDGQVSVQRATGKQETLADVLARSALPTDEVLAAWTMDDGADASAKAQNFADQLQALPVREYSIASLPVDGSMHLLVRQVGQAGQYGIASGWLTHYAPLGADLDVRLRSNANFRLPPSPAPLICIGNGTGIAGLRAHLKARIEAGHFHNWLIFGERNHACDYFYQADIESWRQQANLQRLDLVFSRDQSERHYVQDCVTAAAADIRRWVDDGASILVCGSLEGMAPAVDAALSRIVGADVLERLIADGRYRRDVY